MADPVVSQARKLARDLLSRIPDRWEHTKGVATKATELSRALEVQPETAGRVVAAAWLHDIGCAPRLRDTGFSPLDGARYLNRHQWSFQICSLVAHHCGARFLAADAGLTDRMWPFGFEDGLAMDILTYADQTVGRVGNPETPVAASDGRTRYLRAVAGRIEAALERPAALDRPVESARVG